MTKVLSAGRSWTLCADGLYRLPCGKCEGKGNIFYFGHIHEGVCFKCDGSKWELHQGKVRAKTLKQLESDERAYQRAEVRRAKEFEASAEMRAQAQAAYEAQKAAEAAAHEAEIAAYSHLPAEIGESVTFTGAVLVATTLDTQWGKSRLIIAEDAEKHIVKMFTSAAWSWRVEPTEVITVQATVKAFSVYAEKAQTELSYAKVVK